MMTFRFIGCDRTKTQSSGILFLALWFGLSPSTAHGLSPQQDRYARAESLVRAHRWDQGLSLLAPLLKRDPGNLKALNLAGLACIGKGDTSQANAYFSRAIAADPDFVPALKNLSFSEFNAHQYSAAEKHLEAAEKIVGDDPVIHLYLGEIFYRLKAYKKAANEFSQAQASTSLGPAVSAQLATSYLKTHEPDKALKILHMLGPEQLEPQAQFELAIALDQAGLPMRAIPYFDAVHSKFPNSYEVSLDLMIADLEVKSFSPVLQIGTKLIAAGHETDEVDNILAHAFEGASQSQQALNAYRRAINLDPDNEQNYLDFASLCLHQHAIQTGIKVINIGLSVHPQSARLTYMRGLLYGTEGDFQQAEKDFELSETLSPKMDLGAIGLGSVYLATGNDERTLTLVRKRLRQTPDNASLLYLLAESLLHTGASPESAQYKEAQSALEKSVRLNPELCRPHVALGEIYLDENRTKEAVEQLEKARSIDPKDPSAYSHLAVAYRRLGEMDKATKALDVLKQMYEERYASELYHAKSAAEPSGQPEGASERPPGSAH